MSIIVSTDSDYKERLEGIRIHVNSAYEDCDLSEARITNSAFMGRFNIEIAMSVPGYASLSDSQLSLLKNAVQLKTAALLLWSDGRIRREDVQGEETEYMPVQVRLAIEDYRNQADSIISRITPNSPTHAAQTQFKVINPTKRF